MRRWFSDQSLVRLSLAFWLGAFVPGVACAADDAVLASRLEASVFRDVWHAILEDSGIDVQLVEVANHEDRRRSFASGQLLLDCCSIKAWRDRQEEISVQLWSRPIFYTIDHLVLQGGRTYDLPDPTNLKAYRVAVVRGFSYQREELFGPRVEYETISQVLDAVAAGQADVTIVNSQEFRRLQKMKRRPLVLGPEHYELILRARVHNSRPDLLAKIDAAIERLQASGRIAALTGARLRSVN